MKYQRKRGETKSCVWFKKTDLPSLPPRLVFLCRALDCLPGPRSRLGCHHFNPHPHLFNTIFREPTIYLRDELYTPESQANPESSLIQFGLPVGRKVEYYPYCLVFSS